MLNKAAQVSVLVADDEPEHAEIVATLLTRRGYRVQTVYSAIEAVERAILAPPSLVMLDVYMPALDGVAAAERLRLTPATHRVPIVLATASMDARVRAAANRLQVVLLEKPFHTAELVCAIEVALAKATSEARA
jgi:CheY-like chemotaxis protein